jgi:hypothetical protein
MAFLNFVQIRYCQTYPYQNRPASPTSTLKDKHLLINQLRLTITIAHSLLQQQ